MGRNDNTDWVSLMFSAISLGIEAAEVIALRATNAAKGGSNASNEAWRMCSEKLVSALDLQARLLVRPLEATPLCFGQLAMNHYRAKVAANRVRLSRRLP